MVPKGEGGTGEKGTVTIFGRAAPSGRVMMEPAAGPSPHGPFRDAAGKPEGDCGSSPSGDEGLGKGSAPASPDGRGQEGQLKNLPAKFRMSLPELKKKKGESRFQALPLSFSAGVCAGLTQP